MSLSLIPFEQREYLEPISAFLKDYPGLMPYETLDVSYLKFDPYTMALPPGAGLISVAGSNAVQRSNDITSYEEASFQGNYMFVIQRTTGDNMLRRDFGDFIRNYVDWINMEQAYRNTELRHPLLPRFSNFDNPHEEFRANGEMQFEMMSEDGQPIDAFQLQIQTIYKKRYNTRKDEW